MDKIYTRRRTFRPLPIPKDFKIWTPPQETPFEIELNEEFIKSFKAMKDQLLNYDTTITLPRFQEYATWNI